MALENIFSLSALGGFLITAALFAFAWYRGLAIAAVYAEKGYDPEKFLKWVIKSRNFDKKATLIMLLSYIGWYFLKESVPAGINAIFYLLVFIALLVGTQTSYKYLKSLKRSVNEDPYLSNVHFTYMVLSAAYFGSIFATQQEVTIPPLAFSFLAFFQAPPIFIIVANFIMRPLAKAEGGNEP